MGAIFTPNTSDQTRHGLIGLLAIRQARAIQQRRKREAAEREALAARKTDPTPPKRRRWFG